MDNETKWFSIFGYLYMSSNSGGFKIWKSRKRMFFALDEVKNQLIFFKDEVDFLKDKKPAGVISLVDAALTVLDTVCTTISVRVGDKNYEIFADNEPSGLKWLKALRNRREYLDHNQNVASGTFKFSTDGDLYSQSDSSNNATDTESHQQGASARINDILYRTNHPTSRLPLYNSMDDEKGLNLDDLSPNIYRKSEHSKVSKIPTNFDGWINGWLAQQPQTCDNCEIDDYKCSAHTSFIEEGGLSETTSLCDSFLNSSIPNFILMDDLNRLREISNRQKEKIQDLSEEKKKLLIEISELKEFQCVTFDKISDNCNLSLSAKNKFLNAEIARLSARNKVQKNAIAVLQRENIKLEENFNNYKQELVFLLGNCVRISLAKSCIDDIVQLKLVDSHVYKERILRLLHDARETNPYLPTFESLISLHNYVDEFGFRHSFENENHALHYICTLLYDCYYEKSHMHLEHENIWKIYLKSCNNRLINCRELRCLVRDGVPAALRSTIWKMLVNEQVVDLKGKHGKFYYRNLCNSEETPTALQYNVCNQKQITLDLLRTMPNNVHFTHSTCEGTQKLEQVLRAYCLHNPSIGYCQGMNFIAATALLFLCAEDTFWFLVAVAEKFFHASYFDQSLTGAQADQEVLKEIVENRLPRLAAHFEECGIDLATVTFNWFLALYFDAVPFQTMIRIWDCFLLEGTKVLFRFAVALLSIYEHVVLSRTDTISVIKILKASVRLTYDHSSLFKLAFKKSQRFPSRRQIAEKQREYLTVLIDRLSKRRQLRRILSSSTSIQNDEYPCIELIAFDERNQGKGFICSGFQRKGIISELDITKDTCHLKKLSFEFDCRMISMAISEKNMVFVSLLSGYIVVLHIDDSICEVLWELKLSDMALKLVHHNDRLYAALANGTLSVIEKVNKLIPMELELYHLPIGAAPVTHIVIVENSLWVAVACKIIVFSISTLTTLRKIYVASSASGGSVSLFEKIKCVSTSPYGVWIVTARTTLLQLWRDSDCLLLFDVSFDHSHKKSSLSYGDDKICGVEISAILFVHEQIWVGTSDGYLIIYRITDTEVTRKISNANKLKKMSRYPIGRRLSLNFGSNFHSGHQVPFYYIPTETEMQYEESLGDKNMGLSDGKADKVSLVINQDTRTFVHNDLETPEKVDEAICYGFNRLNQAPAKINKKRRLTFPTHLSDVDSAVSMLSAEAVNGCSSSQCAESRKTGSDLLKALSVTNELSEIGLNMYQSANSSLLSMEYDDLFELYSECEDTLQAHKFQSLKNSRSMEDAQKFLSQDNAKRKLSENDALKNVNIRLRRRDLDFDELLLRREISLEDEQVQCSADFLPDEDPENDGNLNSTSFGIELTLHMKLKISDKPVKCIAMTTVEGKPFVVTCAGIYGEAESVLKWKLHNEDSINEDLWINDPIIDMVHGRRSSHRFQNSKSI